MGIPEAMDALRQRAAFVKDSLHKSQTITDNMVTILGSFDHRLSALETAMRPTQVWTSWEAKPIQENAQMLFNL